MDFIQRLLGKNPTSKKVAKERLRLVLMHDRTSLSADVLEDLKSDLIDTISRYMEIDEENMDISVDSEKDTVALVANIPIIKVKKIS